MSRQLTILPMVKPKSKCDEKKLTIVSKTSSHMGKQGVQENQGKQGKH